MISYKECYFLKRIFNGAVEGWETEAVSWVPAQQIARLLMWQLFAFPSAGPGTARKEASRSQHTAGDTGCAAGEKQ